MTSQTMRVQSSLLLLWSGYHRLYRSDGLIYPQGVIPGERFIIIHPPTGSSYTWIADVEEGAQLLFFMIDFEGRMGGASPMFTVAPSTDSSCLAVNSSSSPTVSTPSQMPSQSTLPGSDASTVGIIAGVMIGGVLLLVSLIILGIYHKRRTSRSSDVSSSPKRGDHLTNGTLLGMLTPI